MPQTLAAAAIRAAAFPDLTDAPEGRHPSEAQSPVDNGYRSHLDPVIWTSAGYVDFLNPEACAARITLEAIATALARIPRFGGHTDDALDPYSVAEHSVWCARQANRAGMTRRHVQAALMHDAPEYLLGDVVTTLKRRLPDYAEFEARAWAAIARRFGLPPDLSPALKAIDLAALATEKRDLLPGCPPWPGLPRPDPGRIRPLGNWRLARHRFLLAARRFGLS